MTTEDAKEGPRAFAEKRPRRLQRPLTPAPLPGEPHMSDSTERYQLPEQLRMAAGAVRDYVRNEIVPLEQQIPPRLHTSPQRRI